MSVTHHGADEPQQPSLSPEQQAAMQRLLNELAGHAEREYPQGRVSADDLGATAFAVAADPEHRIVRMLFTKPVNWIGLTKTDCEKLIALLQEKVREITES